MADEQVADIPVAAPRSRKLLRLFLMVAGGLAAPCLALAAFFLSGTGGDDTPSRPTAAQSGLVTATTTPRKAPAAAPTASTTTTTAPAAVPAAPEAPLRDPFVPLVTQAPAGGAPAR